MVTLPNGKQFDVNSTVAVLEMLQTDTTLNDGVREAVLTILRQKEELDTQRRYIEQHDGAAPEEVLAQARPEAFDALGVIALKLVDLEAQLKELDAKPTYVSSDKEKPRKPLDAQHAQQRKQLRKAHAMITLWGHEVDPEIVSTSLEAFKGLPIAARPGETTQQTVLGMLVFQGGLEPVKYTVQFREDEDKPLRDLERGGLAGTESLKADPRAAEYFAARSVSTVKLTAAVEKDKRKFKGAYTRAVDASGGGAARTKLHIAESKVPQPLPDTGEPASVDAAAADFSAVIAHTNQSLLTPQGRLWSTC